MFPEVVGDRVWYERGADMYIPVKKANFSCHFQWLEVGQEIMETKHNH